MKKNTLLKDNPFDQDDPGSGGNIPAPSPAPPEPQPGPAPIIVPALSLDKIIDHLGYDSGVELIDNALMADVTGALDDVLKRKSGHPLFNPSGSRVRNFDMQYFIARWPGGNTGPQCLFVHKATRRALASSVTLWPRNDFWALLIDLARLG